MNTTKPVRLRNRRGRLARFGIIAITVLVLLGIAGAFLLQPKRASTLLMNGIGKSLGLRIHASGHASYRLRGTPQLVLHDVVAQRPGDDTPLLRAERVYVSVPWSTIRALGDDLTARRIELDAPVLDVPALQRWLATRPPSETKIPVLSSGLRVVRGRIDNDDWSIDGIGVDLPRLAPGKPLRARLQGRYLDPPTRLPFDLNVALSKPANDAGLAAIGKVTLEGDDWTLPAQVYLAGPLHLGDDEVSMSPAKAGISARYVSANTNLPFVLGVAGPLRFDEGVWALDPVVMNLRGGEMIPDANARGAVALGRRLVLRINGDIDAWPGAWPTLPPPLSGSTSAMPFKLDYVGNVDFSDVASLSLQRDDTMFDARFKLPIVLDWVDSGMTGTPLPPLDGRLQTPRIEIAGATLEGVDVEFEDDVGTQTSP